MKKYSMLKDFPGKSLFFFALPMILGNLFQALATVMAHGLSAVIFTGNWSRKRIIR